MASAQPQPTSSTCLRCGGFGPFAVADVRLCTKCAEGAYQMGQLNGAFGAFGTPELAVRRAWLPLVLMAAMFVLHWKLLTHPLPMEPRWEYTLRALRHDVPQAFLLVLAWSALVAPWWLPFVANRWWPELKRVVSTELGLNAGAAPHGVMAYWNPAARRPWRKTIGLGGDLGLLFEEPGGLAYLGRHGTRLLLAWGDIARSEVIRIHSADVPRAAVRLTLRSGATHHFALLEQPSFRGNREMAEALAERVSQRLRS